MWVMDVCCCWKGDESLKVSANVQCREASGVRKAALSFTVAPSKNTCEHVGIQMHECHYHLSPHVIVIRVICELRSPWELCRGLKIYVQSILLAHLQDFDRFIQEIYEMWVWGTAWPQWQSIWCTSESWLALLIDYSACHTKKNYSQTSSGEQDYSNPIWHWWV